MIQFLASFFQMGWIETTNQFVLSGTLEKEHLKKIGGNILPKAFTCRKTITSKNLWK